MKIFYNIMQFFGRRIVGVGSFITELGRSIYLFGNNILRKYRIAVVLTPEQRKKFMSCGGTILKDDIDAIDKFVWGEPKKNPNRIVRGTCRVSGAFRRVDCPEEIK